jgi:hypothetical protein
MWWTPGRGPDRPPRYRHRGLSASTEGAVTGQVARTETSVKNDSSPAANPIRMPAHAMP